MAVNLTGIGLSGGAIGTAREAPESTPAAGAQDAGQSARAPTAAGEVNITRTAGLLAHLEQALKGKPAVDPARVDSLTRAIAAGRYKVQPGKVASALLQSEHALGKLALPEI